MKLFRLILIYFIEALVAINILLCISLNIPYVQGRLGEWGSAALSDLLHTQVSIGRIDMGLLNQIIISDIQIQDQQEQTLLTVQKLSGKLDIDRLLNGNIALNTVQLIRFQANLYQQADSLPTNFQFILDALANEDSTSTQTNIRINSLIVRDGHISFHKHFMPLQERGLDINHLQIHNFNAHLSIKSILRDSMQIRVRNLSFQEKTGFKLNDLTFRLQTQRTGALLSKFQLFLPHTHIVMDTLVARYDWDAPNFLTSLVTHGHMQDCYITPSDLDGILPQLGNFHERIHMQLDMQSRGTDVQLNSLNLRTDSQGLSMQCSGRLKLPKDSTETLAIDLPSIQAQATQTGISNLFSQLHLGEVPQQLLTAGHLTLTGQGATDFKTGSFEGCLSTDIGSLQLNCNLLSNKQITATIATDNLHLGSLLSLAELGLFAGNISIDGQFGQQNLSGKATAQVNRLEFNGYPIQDILLQAEKGSEGITAHGSIYDPHIQIKLDAHTTNQAINPNYQAQLDVAYFHPSVLGILPNKTQRSFHAQVKANLTGRDLDSMDGTFLVQDFQIQDSTEVYQFDNFTLTANRNDQQQQLILQADFMTASAQGQIQYSTLPQSITKILQSYLPSLIQTPVQQKTSNNRFDYDIQLTDARLFQKLFDVDLSLDDTLHISGSLDESQQLLNLELQANRFSYNDNHFERAHLTCQNNTQGLFADLQVNKYNHASVVSLGLHAQAQEDQVVAELSWDNNKTLGRFSGNLNLTSQFQKLPSTPLQIGIQVLPSETVVNDTIWNIRPARIDIHDKLYQISHLLIENDTHRLLVDGRISENPTDSLIAELKDIQVEYVLDAINFDAVQFAGFASGRAIASNLLKAPQADTHLYVRDFRFQTGTMGNMNLYAKWEPETDAIFMEGKVAEFAGHQESNDTARVTRIFNGLEDCQGRTYVIGRISPKYNTINLDITAQNTNANFLQGFVGTVFDDIEGRASGWCKLSNNLIDVDITAQMKADLHATVHALNTRYHIQTDSIEFITNLMQFKHATITDKHGNTALGWGNVSHWYLHRLVYDFQFNTPNLLCFDTDNFGDDGFYATAFVGGDIHINGGPGYMRVNADVTTQPGTSFVYDASIPEEVSNTQFITFVDKTPGKQQPLATTVTLPYFEEEEEEEEEKSDMNIDLQITTTPDATLKVVMDRLTGDFISANGTGTIQANFYNKGSFNMYGILNIEKGQYRMSMQEVIRKDFTLQSGSSVHFNGKPFDANLDVKAIYTVPAANLRDLSATASFAQKTSTRVNCLMNIEGNLSRPSVTFGLDLPTLNEEDKSMVRSLIATDEQTNMQIIYLLGIGRFYGGEIAQEGVSQTNQAMNSILTSTLSSHFNEMLSQVVNTNNWNFGANINPGQQGMNNMEFQTMLQGSLFDNRLQVNGNFGYKENNMMNRNFVGDFDIQWLLNKSGTISLKAYNETNDRYFTRNTLNTQGVGIIFKKDFDSWTSLFRKSK